VRRSRSPFLDKPTNPLPHLLRLEPIHGCSVHTERASHFCDGFAGGDPVHCFPPRVRRELLRPAEAHAARLSAHPALAGRSASSSIVSIISSALIVDVVGAKLSEHARANALDIRAIRLKGGRGVRLTDPAVSKDLRIAVRVCERFTTVLGPGADGYDEDHIHIDLAVRRGGYRIWFFQVQPWNGWPATFEDWGWQSGGTVETANSEIRITSGHYADSVAAILQPLLWIPVASCSSATSIPPTLLC
jgi:hypothetical protein